MMIRMQSMASFFIVSGVREQRCYTLSGLPVPSPSWSRYRPWFRAAVVYNLAWGISVVAYPRWFLWFAGLDQAAAPLAQAIGMMVAVYAYGYHLAARDPERYRDYIWIALAGK